MEAHRSDPAALGVLLAPLPRDAAVAVHEGRSGMFYSGDGSAHYIRVAGAVVHSFIFLEITEQEAAELARAIGEESVEVSRLASLYEAITGTALMVLDDDCRTPARRLN
jgi:hypothetical protein